MEFEVLDFVPCLKLARVTEARLADVDGGDVGLRLAKRVANGLRRAASGNQDIPVLARRAGGPEQMEKRARAIRIRGEIAAAVQIGDGRRIGHALIEVADIALPIHVSPLMRQERKAPARRSRARACQTEICSAVGRIAPNRDALCDGHAWP